MISSVMPYGRMDVERWIAEGHMGKRVLCDGVDITSRCTEFEQYEGYAVCYVIDSEGRHVVNIDELVTETLRGRIEVIG